MNNVNRLRKNSDGFTLIEALVTMVVVTLFVTGFFSTSILVETQRVQLARQSKANDVAYSNLRKFTVRPANLTCDPSTMDLTAVNGSSLPGKLLGDGTNTVTSSAYGFIAEPTSVTQSLGANTTQTVVAYAPSGCSNFATSPIKIVSTVTFGNGDKVTHASYVQ